MHKYCDTAYVHIDGNKPKAHIFNFAIVQETKKIYFAMPHYIAFNLAMYTHYIL